jgi:hypothetical protein
MSLGDRTHLKSRRNSGRGGPERVPAGGPHRIRFSRRRLRDALARARDLPGGIPGHFGGCARLDPPSLPRRSPSGVEMIAHSGLKPSLRASDIRLRGVGKDTQTPGIATRRSRGRVSIRCWGSRSDAPRSAQRLMVRAPPHNRLVAGSSPPSSTTQSCAIPVSWRRRNSLSLSHCKQRV